MSALTGPGRPAPWPLAGSLLAVLMWADSPQRAMLMVTGLIVAVLTVAVIGCLAGAAASAAT